MQQKFPNLSTLNIELNYPKPSIFSKVDDESDESCDDDEEDFYQKYEKCKALPPLFIMIDQDIHCKLIDFSIKINIINKNNIRLNCKAFEI